jgi:hypothetical protein
MDKEALQPMIGLIMEAFNNIMTFSFIQLLFISQLPRLPQLVMVIFLVLTQSKDYFV